MASAQVFVKYRLEYLQQNMQTHKYPHTHAHAQAVRLNGLKLTLDGTERNEKKKTKRQRKSEALNKHTHMNIHYAQSGAFAGQVL